MNLQITVSYQILEYNKGNISTTLNFEYSINAQVPITLIYWNSIATPDFVVRKYNMTATATGISWPPGTSLGRTS